MVSSFGFREGGREGEPGGWRGEGEKERTEMIQGCRGESEETSEKGRGQHPISLEKRDEGRGRRRKRRKTREGGRIVELGRTEMDEMLSPAVL